jgi:predicted permease
MRAIARLRSWWDAIVHRSRVDSDVENELRFHVDAYTEDLVQSGVPAEEAARRAKVEFGQVHIQKERYRAAIGLEPWHELGGDIRYGLRSLWKNPAFSVVAILSLALGIGATTAMFSLIYAVLIHPFPYAGADRIMNPVLVDEERPQQYRWFATTGSQFQTLSRAKSLDSLLGFTNFNMEITGGELPEDVSAIYMTENASAFFGVTALLGRGIQPSDAAEGANQSTVAVLNYGFWQRHYGGDQGIVGHNIQLDHKNYNIVGVMPRSFAFAGAMDSGDIYLPRSLLRDLISPQVTYPRTPWIKLKPGVSRAAADAELQAMLKQFAKEKFPPYPKRFHVQLQPILLARAQGSGSTLWLLFAAVLVLLLVGCLNCSILLLARGEARQHELAVRSAIGASRWRIIRQLLVEALTLSFSGAFLGVALSWWLVRLPLKLAPDSFPPQSFVWINLPILGFSIGVALLTGLLFGLGPAFRLSRPTVSRTMQSKLRRFGSAAGGRTLHGLISSQIASTLVLLAAAGTAIGAFLQVMNIPLGYDPHNVMGVGIVMHWNNPREWDGIKSQRDRATFIEQLRQKIVSIPGVLSVSVGVDATPPYSGDEHAFETLGQGPAQGEQARIHRISPNYFSTLKIPLLRGRLWDQTENMHGDSVAIINESMARHYWPTHSALGQQIRIPSLKNNWALIATSPDSGGWRQVIGVVADARDDGLAGPVAPAIYVPYPTFMEPIAQFQIRTQGEPLALLHSVRTAIASVSSDQQVSNGALDLEDSLTRDPDWSRQRLFSILFAFFSGVALVLALVGLFSVVSYIVVQRTTEFGIRIALGAPRRHILWISARAAALSVSSGVVLGLLINLSLEKLLTRWMNNTVHTSGVLLDVTLLLIVCAFFACLLPARRAVSIHPIEALRYE